MGAAFVTFKVGQLGCLSGRLMSHSLRGCLKVCHLLPGVLQLLRQLLLLRRGSLGGSALLSQRLPAVSQLQAAQRPSASVAQLPLTVLKFSFRQRPQHLPGRQGRVHQQSLPGKG